METSGLRISFKGATAAEANVMAAELKADLESAAEDISVGLDSEQDNTMDMGTILQIILAAPAVIVAAKALHTWLVKRYSATVVVRHPDGTEYELTNLTSRDAVGVALDANRKEE